MTSIRTLAAVLGLLSFCACAAAQSVTRTGDTVNFTHTGVVTRVPVGLPLVDAKGSASAAYERHQQDNDQ